MSLLFIVLSRIDIQKNISSLGSISLPWTTSDVKVHRLCKCSILTVPFKANDMKLVDFFYFLWIRHSGRICLIACYWVGQIFRASMLKFPFWKLEEQIFWIHSLKFSVHLAQKLIYLFFLWNVRKANFFNLPFQVVLSETNERTKETRIAHRLDRPLVKRLMGPQGHICKFYCWKIIWDKKKIWKMPKKETLIQRDYWTRRGWGQFKKIWHVQIAARCWVGSKQSLEIRRSGKHHLTSLEI